MNYDLPDDEELRPDDLGAGPTFEDLAIDDTLSDLDRVTKYICSNIALQRVIHVKMLADTARSVGLQATCDHLIPLLEPLVCDVEYVVRQHVALQFPPLAAFLVQQESADDAGYRALLDRLVPLVSRLVSDKQHEVRSAANESLVALAALVRPEDQGQHVLTIVLPLAHDDDNEQMRISAVTLYHGLAEHLGPELCQQFCVPELISLSEDPVFRVRKSTAQSFASVCRIAGHEVSRERLLPSFHRLAQDDIWAVRKACAECLVSISEALARADRGELLIPLFENFLEDSSRWVRMAAYQSLGPFLASLERKDISDDLLQHYIGMATSSAAAQLGGSGEVDMRFHCAFNLPAVVSILGRTDWALLSPTFETLSQDSFWKIRRTLAHSLHELARILGTEIAETQLATAFDSYLRDIPDVRVGAMTHFADFLEHVSPSFRESYLPVLAELLRGLTTDATKWRSRELLCHQLPQLCRIFSADATFTEIYPLVAQLLRDDVAVVRHQCVAACPLLVARLADRSEWRDAIVERLLTLAASSCFTDRQAFARVSSAFLSREDGDSTATVFTESLADAFFELVRDPVSNVRVVVAEVVLAHREGLLAHASCPTALRDACTEDVKSPEDLLQALLSRLPLPTKTTTTSDDAAAAADARAEPAPVSLDAVEVAVEDGPIEQADA
ncbi:hypothetical protein P43SY_010971 [Pythium insidiosum]|uniref:Serine/threonine-protein phosphatase 4 regulatory subunit 1 n=1 Tax=Pythium insidiosum TaxID=114742 RepID=A0AAD5LKK4_PYTIN|nr:hypothetical protein P43SY_010971 [Pythium insidiosum]